MALLYTKDIIDIALAEDGYQCGANKWNKYAEELDAVDYFVGCGSKQNLNYCSVFTSWVAYRAIRSTKPENYGEFDPSAGDARFFLFQSDTCNKAAVVKYAADYYKQNNAYFTDSSKLCKGDQIFFQNSAGLSHTGWCFDWDAEGFYTIEGNVDGGRVEKRFYKYSEFGNYVNGFGRPRYDGWAYPEPEPEPEPQPTPEPEPAEKTFTLSAKVTVKTTKDIDEVRKILENTEIILSDFGT